MALHAGKIQIKMPLVKELKSWLVKVLQRCRKTLKWLWTKLGVGGAITGGVSVLISLVVAVAVVIVAQHLTESSSSKREKQIAKYTAEVYLDRMQIEERGLDDMLYDNERLGSFFPLSELAVPPSDDISLEGTDPEGTVHDLDYAYGLLVLVFGPSFHASGGSSEANLTPATEPLHHRVCRARTAVIEAVIDLKKAAGTRSGVGLETEHSAVAGKRCLPELVGRVGGARHTTPIGPHVWVLRVHERAPHRTLFTTRTVRSGHRFAIRVAAGSYVVEAQTTLGRLLVKARAPEVKGIEEDEIRSVSLRYRPR